MSMITYITHMGRQWELRYNESTGDLTLHDNDGVEVSRYDGGLEQWSMDEYEGNIPSPMDAVDHPNPYQSAKDVRDMIFAGGLIERMDDLSLWMLDRAIEEGRVGTDGVTANH